MTDETTTSFGVLTNGENNIVCEPQELINLLQEAINNGAIRVKITKQKRGLIDYYHGFDPEMEKW